MNVKSEFFRRVEALTPDQQRQLLDSIDWFTHAEPRGEPGSALLSFVGALGDGSAKEMTEAIKSGCEAIDPREW